MTSFSKYIKNNKNNKNFIKKYNKIEDSKKEEIIWWIIKKLSENSNDLLNEFLELDKEILIKIIEEITRISKKVWLEITEDNIYNSVFIWHWYLWNKKAVVDIKWTFPWITTLMLSNKKNIVYYCDPTNKIRKIFRIKYSKDDEASKYINNIIKLIKIISLYNELWTKRMKDILLPKWIMNRWRIPYNIKEDDQIITNYKKVSWKIYYQLEETKDSKIDIDEIKEIKLDELITKMKFSKEEKEILRKLTNEGNKNLRYDDFLEELHDRQNKFCKHVGIRLWDRVSVAFSPSSSLDSDRCAILFTETAKKKKTLLNGKIYNNFQWISHNCKLNKDCALLDSSSQSGKSNKEIDKIETVEQYNNCKNKKAKELLEWWIKYLPPEIKDKK